MSDPAPDPDWLAGVHRYQHALWDRLSQETSTDLNAELVWRLQAVQDFLRSLPPIPHD